MFNNLVECAKTKKDSKRWGYFAVTSTIWTLALAGTIVGGIFLYDAKLDEQLSLLTLINPPPPPAAPKSGTKTVKPINNVVPKPIVSDVLIRETPREISNDTTNRPTTRLVSASGEPSDFSDLPGIGVGSGIGDKNSTDPGVIGGDPTVNPPVPKETEIKELKVAEPVEKVKPQITRFSEGVIRGNTISQVKPEYPMLARTASVSGEVKIDILISEDGNVISASVISGHTLLQQAALKAAKQWKFNPTKLSNIPVKVQGILTFRFTL